MHKLSAIEIRDRIASGQVTSTETTKAMFDHIEKTDSKIGSYRTLFRQEALDQAKTAESGLEARKKEYLGALQVLEEKKKELSGLDTGKLAELEHKEAELRDRVRLLKEEIENSGKKLVVLKEELESRKEELGKNVAVIDSSVKLRLTP